MRISRIRPETYIPLFRKLYNGWGGVATTKQVFGTKNYNLIPRIEGKFDYLSILSLFVVKTNNYGVLISTFDSIVENAMIDIRGRNI